MSVFFRGRYPMHPWILLFFALDLFLLIFQLSSFCEMLVPNGSLLVAPGPIVVLLGLDLYRKHRRLEQLRAGVDTLSGGERPLWRSRWPGLEVFLDVGSRQALQRLQSRSSA